MKDNPKNLLTSKEILAIVEYKNSLLSRFPSRIEKIFLFGSKARGESNRDSDVDLLVVVTNNNRRISEEIAVLTHHPIAKYSVDLSPITVENKFFEEWSPLLDHIGKDGIVLWTKKKARNSI